MIGHRHWQLQASISTVTVGAAMGAQQIELRSVLFGNRVAGG
jgi:hypothetical protein